ncbi:hypothetical protein [Streptomyces sp. NPDC006368]|uniref:hypothetical protein n=1 Tax=Streptomyces sp. NPDC006368 TaxID=3156760 RepID=UPI0033A1878D
MTDSNKGTATTEKAATTAAKTAETGKSAAGKATRESSRSGADAAGNARERTAAVVSGPARAVASTLNGVSRTAVSSAGAAWVFLRSNVRVATGVAAGATAVAVTAYAGGRRSVRRSHGPVTRLTGGRF